MEDGKSEDDDRSGEFEELVLANNEDRDHLCRGVEENCLFRSAKPPFTSLTEHGRLRVAGRGAIEY